MLVHTQDPERFGRCVDSAWVASNQCPRRSVVALIHKVETALVPFSSDRAGEGRKADADVDGEWRRPNVSRRLE
jgi:hypothetical protein